MTNYWIANDEIVGYAEWFLHFKIEEKIAVDRLLTLIEKIVVASNEERIGIIKAAPSYSAPSLGSV